MINPQVLLSFCVSFIVLQMFPLFAVSSSEQDKVRYISDVHVINIKNNLEKPYEIIATVQSGDPVHVLEQKGNYSKIETAEGKQGWIGKQYLKSESPKILLTKQLQQEISDLKTQLAAKQAVTPETAIIGKPASGSPCQEIQLKLNDAEKLIARLQEELKAPQPRLPDPSSKASELVVDGASVSIEQLEQTPENYALLISECDKRGKQISELQKTISKKDDQTRFLWFAAGAVVFLTGMLMGRSSNRKKGKLTY